MEKVLSLVLSIAVDYADVAFTVSSTGKKPRIAPVGKPHASYTLRTRLTRIQNYGSWVTSFIAEWDPAP